MFSKKQILILFLGFIILLLTSSTIYASEGLNTTEKTKIKQDTTHEKIITKTIKKQKNNNKKTESETTRVTTNQELENALESSLSSNAETCVIDFERTDYTLTNEFKWNTQNPKTLILNGNHSSISTNNRKRLFTIGVNNTLIINNLTITNTKSTYGSALYNRGKCIVDNCTFKNNNATHIDLGGGAILNGGLLTIDNSLFENNEATSGGAIYNRIYVGNPCKISLNNCTFQENIAKSGSAITNTQTDSIYINSSTFNNNIGDSSITNFKGLFTINNSIMKNYDNENLLMIENNDEMRLLNLTICNNRLKTAISNTNIAIVDKTEIYSNNILDNLIINNQNSQNIQTQINITNSEISSNIAKNNVGLINLDSNGIITINNSIFYNNTSENDMGIISDNYGKTKIYQTRFQNNTSLDLFVGTTDTFIEVIDNEYLGNNLRSTSIELDSEDIYSTDNEVIINGILLTNVIYNTTVNSGLVTVSIDDEIIENVNVNNGKFTFKKLFSTEGEVELSFSYNGLKNFTDTKISKDIQLNSPLYTVEILNVPETFNFTDIISYEVKVSNIGLVPVNNIKLSNITPDGLKFIKSNDNVYLKDNQWNITQILPDENKIIKIETSPLELKDLTLMFNIHDLREQTDIVKVFTVKLLKSDYSILINCNNSNPVYGDIIKYNITIKNIGNSAGKDIKINLTNIFSDFTFEIDYLNIGENHSFTASSQALCTNELINYVKLRDFLDVFINEEFSTTITNPIIELEELTTHPGDKVNISINLKNFNKDSIKDLIFKINFKTYYSYSLTFKDNIITLHDFIIPESLSKEEYLMIVEYDDIGFDNVLISKSKLILNKRNVYSILNSIQGIPNETVNFEAHIYDYDNNPLSNGYVVFKINDVCQEEYVEVNDGIALLENVNISQIDSNYSSIKVVYSGDNIYSSNSNYSSLKIEKIDTETNLNVSYDTKNIYFKSQVNTLSGVVVNEGSVVFKINNKSVSKKISLRDNIISFVYEIPYKINVKSFSVHYYGNYLYNPSKYNIVLDEIKCLKKEV
ncbi:MAG: hypothetical protein IJJ47_02380 [Methanosphaera sp.]|nr:hypothetical protein [Methanosphaera sp.]